MQNIGIHYKLSSLIWKRWYSEMVPTAFNITFFTIWHAIEVRPFPRLDSFILFPVSIFYYIWIR